LRAAVAESWSHSTTRGGLWEAKIAEGRPVVRVLLGDRWCELHLKNAAWGAAQRTAYEQIASGEAAGELLFYRKPTGDSGPQSEFMCRIVAWLPRDRTENACGSQDGLQDGVGEFDPRVGVIGEIGIADLREAIRANRVSFPSQVPTFPKHDRPDLQRQLAQLYFVLGWNCSAIGTRYGLHPGRVRQILDRWRRRAVKAGYIQEIPPAGMDKCDIRPSGVVEAPKKEGSCLRWAIAGI